jgi:glycosyltransferase involved in cell wall biosynthesis
VKKEYPEFSLKIAGQEPPEKYKAFVEYEGVFNKSDEVQLIKLKQLFAEAFCFVLPTGKDMTPLVLLEAASAGCPVIATDRFGIPEMIINNETGILLNGGQPLKEQLVSAMKRMISDKAIRKRFAERSREYVEQHFSWHKTGSIICEKLFESFPAWKEQQ